MPPCLGLTPRFPRIINSLHKSVCVHDWGEFRSDAVSSAEDTLSSDRDMVIVPRKTETSWTALVSILGIVRCSRIRIMLSAKTSLSPSNIVNETIKKNYSISNYFYNKCFASINAVPITNNWICKFYQIINYFAINLGLLEMSGRKVMANVEILALLAYSKLQRVNLLHITNSLGSQILRTIFEFCASPIIRL